MVFDPELIARITVKDFSHFTDHGLRIGGDPLQARNMFHSTGQRWKELRLKLIPTFTSGKLKGMFPLMLESSDIFEKHLDKVAASKEAFDAKELIGRFFTDMVGSTIFGIDCNTLEEPHNQFRVMGQRLATLSKTQAMKLALIAYMPEISLKLKLTVLDSDLRDFFFKLTKDLVEKRKKTNTVRKDFLQLLIELKEKGNVAIDDDDEDKRLKENFRPSETVFKFDDTDMTALLIAFYLAGFDNTSSAATFALLELALNPEVQRKVQLEIDEFLMQNDGKVTYNALREMKYLEWVLYESMRKYPVVGIHGRVCTKKYTIPGTKVTLDEGVIITIPNYALQNDAKYFPDPERFDPERFSADDALHKYQYVYTPFGEGPRQCIGNRFALIQDKLALLSFLRRYSVKVNSKTQLPVKLNIKQFLLNAEGGIWLDLEKRATDQT
ncbi:Hypothetical predicted protein [Cloeon dipterum]|nr:Hypothetical predicted protein [Cloeon dipterum]